MLYDLNCTLSYELNSELCSGYILEGLVSITVLLVSIPFVAARCTGMAMLSMCLLSNVFSMISQSLLTLILGF